MIPQTKQIRESKRASALARQASFDELSTAQKFDRSNSINPASRETKKWAALLKKQSNEPQQEQSKEK